MGSAAAARRALAALRRAASFLRPATPPTRSARPVLRPVRTLYPPRAATSPTPRTGAVLVVVRVMAVGSLPRAPPFFRTAPPPLRSARHLLRGASPLPPPVSPLGHERYRLRRANSMSGQSPTAGRRATSMRSQSPTAERGATTMSGQSPTAAGYPLHRATSMSDRSSTAAEFAKIHERLDTMMIQDAKTNAAVERIASKQAEEPKRDWGSITIRDRPLSLPGFVSLLWRFLDLFK